ncbi:hypothetical protein PHLGIDRAFT_458587 [Phlebiopsis gigantea 11061_1 CR5-6]|uniref:Uncharacterized protein n=1 Tax=Phlebiopsis gigantea (strain 11061_1 CR5-6) TaxID=745531 RepID=A0A0C3P1F4_PHLG1|nr:hypothetical protein PHLGIDRAFT_458587 [Phlebiopsis gigantea 11061_1 CR5-6]
MTPMRRRTLLFFKYCWATNNHVVLISALRSWLGPAPCNARVRGRTMTDALAQSGATPGAMLGLVRDIPELRQHIRNAHPNLTHVEWKTTELTALNVRAEPFNEHGTLHDTGEHYHPSICRSDCAGELRRARLSN